MIRLDNFLEEARAGGNLLAPVRKVYRMDDNSPGSNMRKSAGLGTCNCCDYFTFDNTEAIILIEETQIVDQIKNLNIKYRYLKIGERNRYIKEIIKRENKLKVYGSLLVLCYLARNLTKNEEALALSRKVDFWLVTSGSETDDNWKILDNFKDELLQDLRGALTGAVVNNVKILPACLFAKKLPPLPSVNI